MELRKEKENNKKKKLYAPNLFGPCPDFFPPSLADLEKKRNGVRYYARNNEKLCLS